MTLLQRWCGRQASQDRYLVTPVRRRHHLFALVSLSPRLNSPLGSRPLTRCLVSSFRLVEKCVVATSTNNSKRGLLFSSVVARTPHTPIPSPTGMAPVVAAAAAAVGVDRVFPQVRRRDPHYPPTFPSTPDAVPHTYTVRHRASQYPRWPRSCTKLTHLRRPPRAKRNCQR